MKSVDKLVIRQFFNRINFDIQFLGKDRGYDLHIFSRFLCPHGLDCSHARGLKIFVEGFEEIFTEGVA